MSANAPLTQPADKVARRTGRFVQFPHNAQLHKFDIDTYTMPTSLYHPSPPTIPGGRHEFLQDAPGSRWGLGLLGMGT